MRGIGLLVSTRYFCSCSFVFRVCFLDRECVGRGGDVKGINPFPFLLGQTMPSQYFCNLHEFVAFSSRLALQLSDIPSTYLHDACDPLMFSHLSLLYYCRFGSSQETGKILGRAVLPDIPGVPYTLVLIRLCPQSTFEYSRELVLDACKVKQREILIKKTRRRSDLHLMCGTVIGGQKKTKFAGD